MLFNSFSFALFLPVVFLLYWFVANKELKLQNILLVAASSLFYGWWDWRFLILLYFTAFLDYFISLAINNTEEEKKRKILVSISILANLTVLGFFKYYNFFIDSWIQSFSLLGIQVNQSSMNIILPVGVSFYTFQSIGYTVDVYRKKLAPPKDPIIYLAFVSFFPQLVAGPIERATHMLPQFSKKRHFNYEQAKDGVQQILWGLFKKIVIADNCALYVNEIFDNYEVLPASALLLGSVYFAFQIYCDFSGYSDMAIGIAKLLNFELMSNFNYPYFSRSIPEFWRRWHISLSTWFRDYLYIPLGGSRGNFWFKFRNTMIVFTVSGFWHGANWTFICWGIINGLYFIPSLLKNSNKSTIPEKEQNPSLRDIPLILSTFFLTCFTWIFFRADNMTKAIGYIKGIFNVSLFSVPSSIQFMPVIILFILAEWIQRDKRHGLQLSYLPIRIRWSLYYCLIGIILLLGEFGSNTFIYFQF